MKRFSRPPSEIVFLKQAPKVAREFLGYPFREQGRAVDFNDGLDCGGLIAVVGERMGYASGPEWDRKGYSFRPLGYANIVSQWLEDWFDPIESPEPGCVACFVINRASDYLHLAIIGENDRGLTMIHVWGGSKVVETSFAPPWSRRGATYWRWR